MISEKINELLTGKTSDLEILVSQIKLASEILFEANRNNQLVEVKETLESNLKKELDFIQPIMIDIIKKNISLSTKERESPKAFLKENKSIMNEFRDKFWANSTNYLTKLFEDLAKQIELETIEGIEFVYNELFTFICDVDFIDWYPGDLINDFTKILMRSKVQIFLIPEIEHILCIRKPSSYKDINALMNAPCSPVEDVINALHVLKTINNADIVIPFIGECLFYEERIYSDYEKILDEAEQIRFVAAKLLGNYKTEQSRQLLLEGLEKSNGSVLTAIITSLEEVGDGTIAEFIYPFLPGIIRELNETYCDGDSSEDKFIYTFNENCQKAASNALKKFGLKPELRTGVRTFISKHLLKLLNCKKELNEYDTDSIKALYAIKNKHLHIYKEELTIVKKDIITKHVFFKKILQRL